MGGAGGTSGVYTVDMTLGRRVLRVVSVGECAVVPLGGRGGDGVAAVGVVVRDNFVSRLD